MLAEITLKRGDALSAYDQIAHCVLPYALENGNAKMRLDAFLTLAKVCLQLSNKRNLMPCQDKQERSAFEEASLDPNQIYQNTCL